MHHNKILLKSKIKDASDALYRARLYSFGFPPRLPEGARVGTERVVVYKQSYVVTMKVADRRGSKTLIRSLAVDSETGSVSPLTSWMSAKI